MSLFQATTATPAPSSFHSSTPAAGPSTNGFRMPPSSNHSPSPARPVSFNGASAPWANHASPYQPQATPVTMPMRNLTFGNASQKPMFSGLATRQPDFVNLSCDDSSKQTPTKPVQVKQEMMRKAPVKQEPVRRMMPVDSFDDAI